MRDVGTVAIIVLLAVIALQLNAIQRDSIDPTPGWHDVVQCDTSPGDGYYNNPGWCPVH